MARRLLLATTIVLAATLVGGPGSAAGDAAAGKKVFNKCKTCHEVEQTKNKVGPHLVGIIGRKAGAVEDFKYSDNMKNSGIVWDEATIAAYLKDPKGYIQGNKMTFAGLKSDDEIADLLAYLKSVQPK
jgi:cytochrome c